MIERLNKCPLCKSGLFLNHTETVDHAISKESFVLCKCSDCELLFTNPRPSENEIGKYYDSEDYISHQNKSTNLTNLIYKAVRNFTVKTKVKWINIHGKPNGRLLDYGCGTGFFLKKAVNKGWTGIGYEPNPTAKESAADSGLQIYSSIRELEQERKFDVITLFHVLEHIHTLRNTSKFLINKLKQNGTLLIGVPNLDSFDSKHYKENWASLDVPRHLYHFTQKTMERYAEEMGLKIIDQKPMYFDSYYVSMLSENYVHPENKGIKNLFKALSVGFKSNNWAKNHKGNYSSILFILKKK